MEKVLICPREYDPPVTRIPPGELDLKRGRKFASILKKLT